MSTFVSLVSVPGVSVAVESLVSVPGVSETEVLGAGAPAAGADFEGDAFDEEAADATPTPATTIARAAPVAAAIRNLLAFMMISWVGADYFAWSVNRDCARLRLCRR